MSVFHMIVVWQDTPMEMLRHTPCVISTSNTATLGYEEDLDASAYYLGVSWMPAAGLEQYELNIQAQIGHYSGDDSDTDDEEETYWNYGDNDQTMVVEGNDYGFGLSANYDVIRFTGSVRLDPLLSEAGLSLPGEWRLDAGFHTFSLAEDSISVANASNGIKHTEDDLGTEFDWSITWQYSDNLSFTYGFGSWSPGDAVQDINDLGGRDFDSSGDDDDVTISRFSTAVTF